MPNTNEMVAVQRLNKGRNLINPVLDLPSGAALAAALIHYVPAPV